MNDFIDWVLFRLVGQLPKKNLQYFLEKEKRRVNKKEVKATFKLLNKIIDKTQSQLYSIINKH